MIVEFPTILELVEYYKCSKCGKRGLFRLQTKIDIKNDGSAFNIYNDKINVYVKEYRCPDCDNIIARKWKNG